MLAIRVTIERFTDESQPGFVECRLTDAAGNAHLFEEKAPVVSSEDLDSRSEYPRDGIVACRAIASRTAPDGREVVTVEGIESKAGETRFDVFREQLFEFSHGAG